ncbi:PREDICTED: uncharacterized protein LOC109176865 isoform X2 [Ipomoea nil]|uniref:uncharacterized protein LOC109176865 isoform X2 n=1 Tax=Ipomoea nil TaxID=35883 RepID=UPI000900E8ED|nr:PREDICTED: uncharacterized protein LOC109176865 isoform X2 [Ipomoea nil]
MARSVAVAVRGGVGPGSHSRRRRRPRLLRTVLRRHHGRSARRRTAHRWGLRGRDDQQPVNLSNRCILPRASATRARHPPIQEVDPGYEDGTGPPTVHHVPPPSPNTEFASMTRELFSIATRIAELVRKNPSQARMDPNFHRIASVVNLLRGLIPEPTEDTPHPNSEPAEAPATTSGHQDDTL